MLPMLPGPDSPWSQPENAHPPEKPRRHRKTVRVRLTWVDRRLKIGVALQAGAILSFPLFNWLLSGYFAWLPELVISIPLFLASPFFLMNSKAAPLPLRLGLSFWYLVLVPIQLVMTVYNSPAANGNRPDSSGLSGICDHPFRRSGGRPRGIRRKEISLSDWLEWRVADANA